MSVQFTQIPVEEGQRVAVDLAGGETDQEGTACIHQDVFFENAEIAGWVDRASFYADSGVPVHLSGPAGLGKTALALKAAERLGRPVDLMTGHEWLTVEDLVGREVGFSETKVDDRYIQSVRRTELRFRSDWRDSLLVRAMLNGHTLVYDEFTRASPQANAAMLSVLEEGIVVSTNAANDRTYIEAHPNFRIILTSNSKDYAGVNSLPDALLDRMVTLNLSAFSAETEIGIVATRSGADRALAGRIVKLMRSLRSNPDLKLLPSMRASILMARILAGQSVQADLAPVKFHQIAADIIGSRNPERSNAELLALVAACDPAPGKGG